MDTAEHAGCYECDYCKACSPKDLWGPGHVRCPVCKSVQMSPYEAKQYSRRSALMDAANEMADAFEDPEPIV